VSRNQEAPTLASELRLMADIAEALREPVSAGWLTAFVAERDDGALLPPVWGHIRWKKTLGRPAGSLAGGFEVWELNRGVEVTDFESPSGVRPIPGDIQYTLWDGPDDETFHRVTFTSRIWLREGVSSVVPRFTSVAWAHGQEGRGLWRFDPPFVMYDWAVVENSLVVLPEFEVLRSSLVFATGAPFLTVQP
jgi:hypothetical protein